MEPISNIELDNYLLNCLNNASQKDALLFDMFTNFYNTGLRANEILQQNRWSITIDNKYLCDTEKNSLNRIFEESELTTMFVNGLKNNYNPYDFNSYSTCKIYFSRFLGLSGIYHDTKKLQLSLFRHNKAKLLHDKGMTDEQIKEYFGEVEIMNMRNYIYSELMKG
jgi:hypothetical protein